MTKLSGTIKFCKHGDLQGDCPTCTKIEDLKRQLAEEKRNEAKCDRCGTAMAMEEVCGTMGFVDVDYCPKCKWTPLVDPRRDKEIADLRAQLAEAENKLAEAEKTLRYAKGYGAETTLKDRLKAMASQVRGEEDTQGPSWTCGDCGSARNHGITYPSTPNGPEEHDMVCDDCGSLNIAESPEEAALGLGLKLDECRAEIIGLREDLAEWKRIADGAMADANQRTGGAYSGTREDWQARAYAAEAKVEVYEDLVVRLAKVEHPPQGADGTFEKLDVAGCEGGGRCHGALKWCDLCGDVSGVCDSVDCDVHVSCASCGHKITQHGSAQSMGCACSWYWHEGRMKCLMSDAPMTEQMQMRVVVALNIAKKSAQVDGAHHKAWCLDQMVRALTGDGYSDWIAEYKAGEDGPETYAWDEGCPP